MEFRIADTFTDSLGRLTGQEQKAVKTTAFDLQMDSTGTGMQFHRLNKSRDPNFWSVRVGRDIRLIVHKTGSSVLLCYVNRHDKAYAWAERRKLQKHPKTGAAQLVEVRETVTEIPVPVYVETEPEEPTKPLLFEGIDREVLLTYGVPEEWVDDVLASNEDTLLELADHLPSEAAEAVLDLAMGVTPPVPEPIPEDTSPFDHPDAQRRFRVMDSVEELRRALDYPWEKWTVFLHPAQKVIVENDFGGPARVSGSAGTGKTIVALHRAVFLARSNPDGRVLLTTFSDTLAKALQTKLRRLISNEPRLGERIEVLSMSAMGQRLYKANIGRPQIADQPTIRDLMKQVANEAVDQKFSLHFLMTEWEQVVDAWQLRTWEAYRDVARLGRKKRLPETQRTKLWAIFSEVRKQLEAKGFVTHADVFGALADKFEQTGQVPFEHVVVDEAQDIGVAQLRFLASIGGDRANSLFFAGDLGQRIFQTPFSWKGLGVDIRGRSKTLRINYRTSHQIRMKVDCLLADKITDVDGNTEDRSRTISVFNGPVPTIMEFDSPDEEIQAVSAWLDERKEDGMVPHEVGVFVRSMNEMPRAKAALESAGMPYKVLDENVETTHGHASISTMHLAKGLEFRAVVVMACDDEVIPMQERIETVADQSDLEEVYNTERHLLYVACTRARDRLLLTCVDPASEFLDDLRM